MAKESASQTERRKARPVLSEEDQEFLTTIRSRFGTAVKKQKKPVSHLGQTQLKSFLRINDGYLTKNLFRVMDGDNDGKLSEKDIVEFVQDVILGSDQKKLHFLFDLHDSDGDGKISPAELDNMFKASLRHSKLKIKPAVRKDVVSALVKRSNQKSIDFVAFRKLLLLNSDIRKSMLSSISIWFGARAKTQSGSTRKSFASVLRYIFVVIPYHLWRFALIAGYIGANIWFFTDAFLSYRAAGANIFIQIARGGGACLNFNGMLILIPMMRTLLSWIRKTFLFFFVPVDENIEIHKWIGRVMFLFALVHTGAHIGNYLYSGMDVVQNLFTTAVGLTGFITMSAFLVIWFFSLRFIRRSKFYEWFSSTHLLYLVWFPAALIHVRSFFYWTIIPVAGFIIELLIRKFIKRQQTFVDACDTHDSGVTHLKLHRPENFNYKPGEYLFLRIPRISRFGWHPFTISSAPENTKTVDVHVRALGNWTKRLYSIMSTLNKNNRRMPAQIHGPYGTPSVRIFKSKVAVLIGAGIGVTPFASILESIIRKKEQGISMSLEKVYFYWIYRGQDTFKWFGRLLNDISSKNLRMLDINIYMTDAKIDPVTGLLKIGMDLVHKTEKSDVLTGLQTKTNFGRPQWETIFSGIGKKHSLQRVNVFYCGPYPLGKIIESTANSNGFHFRMENF